MQQEQLHVSQQVQIIHQTFDGIIADLAILSKHNDFQHISAAQSDQTELHIHDLAGEFKQFHIYKPHYDQIRFLDTNGVEMIRTNSNDGTIELTDRDSLQQESSRPYFIHAMQLGQREAYISPLELNMKDGRIQQPFRPTIRFSMPLFNSKGDKFGVLALNYHAEYLLNQLQATTDNNHPNQLLLLNSDGYWLMNPDPAKTWGFMLPERANQTFKQQHPKLWTSIIASASSSQLEQPDGLYTFAKVHPLDSIKNRLSENIPANLLYKAMPDQYTWILVSFIPKPALAAMIRPESDVFIFITILLLLIGAMVSYQVAHHQTSREQTRLQLAEKDVQIRNIVDAALNGIITINEHGIIASFNPAACRMFGHEEKDVIGKNVSIIVSSPHDSAHDSYLQRYVSSGEAHIIGKPREVIASRKDGTTFPVELFVTARQNGEHWQFIGILHDISERKAMEAKLTALATTDGLTGIYNRAYFNEQLHEEFKRAKRYQTQSLSLLLLDADHFKSVNDYYGHPAGDAVLIAIAQKAKACARETDIVARYGGEEFVIILPNTNGTDALKLAERLRQSIESMQVNYEGQSISRTVSIGIACLQDKDLNDEDSLLVQADQALYKAKNGGRNRVVLNHV
jgi:diguanylate cyclase (GGDEF)-like protein/PAS domain S-box-containing protein